MSISSKNSAVSFSSQGFTLPELLVTIITIVIVFLGFWGALTITLRGIMQARCRLLALEIANQQMEIIRNFPYAQIGTTEGWPSGNIPSNQIITKEKINFTIRITPRYIDDPFDGLAPQDRIPNDYKKIEIQVTWDKYPCPSPVSLTSTFAPKGLETTTGTGTLFITVFNASGQPVPQAQIQVKNIFLTPNIIINDRTDNDGELKIYALPISVERYQIKVTKSGYSADYTITPNTLGNSTPIKPDVSIIEGEITSVSFNIDKLSTVNIFTVNERCSSIENISFTLSGGKLIGTEPDVVKYSQNLTTNIQGQLSLSLEWDTYNINLNSSFYDLAGSNPLLPLELMPDTVLDLYLVLKERSDHKLLVIIKDAGNGQPISGAEVILTKAAFSQTKITGFGIWTQTDWQEGPGQRDFINEKKYWEDDKGVDTTSSPGNVLLYSGPPYLSFEEEFKDTAYKDQETTTAIWDTVQEEVRLPQVNGEYLTQAAVQSLKLNLDPRIISRVTLGVEQDLNGQTIDYFLSADGGEHFEIVNPGETHEFIWPGNDLRWKALLRTDNSLVTPSIEEVDISYTFADTYVSSGNLTSSIFDTGHLSPNYGALRWGPGTQNPDCGANCLKFQIASSPTNVTETVWTFLGPNGAENTYYTVSNTSIYSGHDNHRFIRYKAFLSTQNKEVSPILSDVFIAYTALCSKPGQVFFPNLEAGVYNITIKMPGYVSYSDTINVSQIDRLEIPLSK